MERPKLRLKEQPSTTNASKDWLQTRYAQPKPPSVLERFIAAFKRLGRLAILVVVAASAFLAIPFRAWDDYTIWQQIQAALIRLEAHPDSLPELKRISASANSAMLLWNEPSGARPEKWYQYFQQTHYDECYGIIQVLALGLIQQGNAPRGLRELEQLQQRTEHGSVPDLPCPDPVIKICTKCKAGKIVEECPACKGLGKVTVPNPAHPFPLNWKVGASQGAAKRLGDDPLIPQKCPNCDATGRHTITCPSCGGHHATIKNINAVPNLLQETVKGTITAIDRSMTFRRVIHAGATVQQAFLRRSGEIGNGVLAVVHVDPIFENTNPTASALPSSQTNELGSLNDIDSRRAETDGQGAAVQDPVEARLQQACETLLHTPQSAPDLQILAEVSRSATNKPALRSCAMEAFGLSRLLQGNTNAFTRFVKIQKTAYPDLPLLFAITEGDYIATCDDCLGEGKKDTPCPSCMGTNKCKVCNGTGKTAAGDGFVPCEACRHHETCRMCKGQKRMNTTCPTCKGTGKIFKPNDNVRNNYNAFLTNIVTICQENFTKAQREAMSRKPTDLQIHQERSTSEQAGKQLNWKVLSGIVFLISGLLLILFIPHHFTRKRTRGLISLPGMNKIDATQFIDPLTLTAQESKARAKTTTAEIPHAEE